jgi:prolyl oligopeptidase
LDANLFTCTTHTKTLKFLIMKHILVCISLLISFSTIAQQTMQYPNTRKDNTTDTYFGKTVADPYRWLEDDRSTETANWVTAQNKVTDAYLANIPFREAIKKRYTNLINYEKYSAPFKEGNYTYYYKNNGLQNQFVLYREHNTTKKTEVFLDPNSFSKDGTTSLAAINFTKDGSLAAYNISEGGSDWQSIIVINATTKKIIDDTIKNVKFSSARWYKNEGFYYSTYGNNNGSNLSAKNDNHKVYYHKLGTKQANDVLVFGGNANEYFRYAFGGVSENQQWLILNAANATYGGTVFIKNMLAPNSQFIQLVNNEKNNHVVVDVDDTNFYIQTDLDAPTNKLVIAPISNPTIENWKTIIAPTKEVLEASSGGGVLFCSYLKDAVTKVFQYSKKGVLIREIKLPGVGTGSGFSAKQTDKELYYSFTSYIQPTTIYSYNIQSGASVLYKKTNVQFDASKYESKQVFYTSKDGTKIPMIITHKKGLVLNGNNPCLLYGYGGFSVSLTPYFSTSNIILLENGGIYAVANLRGGGEYGEDWHNQGVQQKKQNVFDDFMAAADYLVNTKYTSRTKLAIEGGSNGGLLVGACITQNPTMCKVAFPAVGVLDMLRYHKFTAGAGWAYDYGTSEQSKEMFEYLLGYSPLHNVKPVAYPATLVTTADHDDRVVPAHSFKFAATLQEMHKGSTPVLISIQTKGGHGAGRSIQQTIQEQTDKWAFMFYNMSLAIAY